jgi:16S rRNA (cytosine967-C5)-methyltransferase
MFGGGHFFYICILRAKTTTMSEKKTLNLQPLLIRSVAEALFSIFCEQRYADKVIEYTLRNNKKAGSRDRAFIAETTYEIVRYYRLYTELLGRKAGSQWDFWQICGIHFIVTQRRPLPAFQEFSRLDYQLILEEFDKLQNKLAVRESIPDWLDNLGREELGERWEATLHALNQPARVVLRTNRLKTERKQLQDKLASEQIFCEPAGERDALVLRQRKNVFQSEAFRKGLFEVQDYSSQLVAPLLAPEPGMRVVDACAGGGGKTLHLAAMMQNRGLIIALDTLEWKLDALRLRARRAGATNIETRVIENNKVIKRLYASADRLLLDVPCTGLGVLRRNPDTKWKLTPQQVTELEATQQSILQSYSPILKSGGKMVYATCSVLPSENSMQVKKFLDSEAGKDFQLTEEHSILPQDEGYDGFYMALLSRS